MHLNEVCYGQGLTKPQAGEQAGLTLAYMLDYYRQSSGKNKIFNRFFEKPAGTKALRHQIEAGKSEQGIRKSWEPGLAQLQQACQKHLLYRDFW
jgi:hypothetical protein